MSRKLRAMRDALRSVDLMRQRASVAARDVSMPRFNASTASLAAACIDAHACSHASSNARSVRQIEHSSRDHAFFSCDAIRLRVQSGLKFGCSISLINKRRSITELNPDSRPPHFFVKPKRRQAIRTIRFCGVVPSLKLPLSAASTAPAVPAVPASAPVLQLPVAGLMRRRILARRSSRLLASRRTEFISVSGLGPERSALHSDLRLKRFSGSAAAPALPRAPMNSPDAHAPGFLLNH